MSVACESYVVGQVYEFNYPLENRDTFQLRYQRRRFKVFRIRDLQDEPLLKATLSNNPSLRRARYLLCGMDLDLVEFRQFYVDSMAGVVPSHGPFYRVGVYEPDAPWSEPELIGSVFSFDEEGELESFVADVARMVNESGCNDKVGVFWWQ